MINLKKHFLVKFVLALFVVGIIFGIVFFFVYKPNLGATVKEFSTVVKTTHQNTFLSSLLIVSAMFVLSISIIGLPIVVFYIFYEGLSIGFSLSLFVSSFKLGGFFFYILYFLFSKAIYLSIIGYFLVLSLRYGIKFIESVTTKNRESLYNTVVLHTTRFLIIFFALLINCTLIYFVSNKALSLFVKLINN